MRGVTAESAVLVSPAPPGRAINSIPTGESNPELFTFCKGQLLRFTRAASPSLEICIWRQSRKPDVPSRDFLAACGVAAALRAEAKMRRGDGSVAATRLFISRGDTQTRAISYGYGA